MKKNLIHEFGLARSNVVRIYNPVDINSIGVLASSEPRPVSDPGPNLIAVGRFSHEKGFDLLLRAMPHVRQAVPTAVVTLVGEGPDLPLLQALQRELGLESCVRFVGVRRNPYPFLKHADLAVLPSR
ncbi:MAG: glycosyl transferase, partial [Acidobacteria bacterium]